MTQGTLSCPKCRVDLLLDQLAPLGQPAPCPSCARPLEGLVFPALHRPQASGKQAEALIAAEDAGCFYHPQSRAQMPCDACGRFLCALCDVELQGQHLCPNCLDSGRKKKTIRTIDDGRILYGGMASITALLPLVIFWPLTILTGPLAVFLAIYGLRKPRSITGHGWMSFIVAIVFGLGETLAWLFFFASLFGLFSAF